MLAITEEKTPDMFKPGGKFHRILETVRGAFGMPYCRLIYVNTVIDIRVDHSLTNVLAVISSKGNHDAYSAFVLGLQTSILAESVLISLETLANNNTINDVAVAEMERRALHAEEYRERYHAQLWEQRQAKVVQIQYYCVYWFMRGNNIGFEYWDDNDEYFVPSDRTKDRRSKFWFDWLLPFGENCAEETSRHLADYPRVKAEATESRTAFLHGLKDQFEKVNIMKCQCWLSQVIGSNFLSKQRC